MVGSNKLAERDNKGRFIKGHKSLNIPRLCSHGILGTEKCRKCINIRKKLWRITNPEKHRKKSNLRTHRRRQNNPEKIRENQKRWKKQNVKKIKVYNLIQRHPEYYPLKDECDFCNITKSLEHGHLDYEDNGFNYLTVCHQCNQWMGK